MISNKIIIKISLIFLIITNFKKIVVVGIIIFSKPFFPEASEILQHYCFGNGETLIINSNYLKKSPVILNNIKNMKCGETKKVWFDQKNDWRLSYAINGFKIKKTKNKVKIYQFIKFDKTNEIYTILNFYFFKVKIKDNFVHTFKCTPFMVESEFNY